MKIKFLGAAGTVTGSKTLIESAEGSKCLVDCGLFQGLKQLRLKNWANFDFNPEDIDAVYLTHAHIDHSGALPLLVKKGFQGRIYATEATFKLCSILLPDAGYLQEEEARLANKEKWTKHSPARALFTREDALKSLEYFQTVARHEWVGEKKSLKARFFRAGHIFGACSVQIKCDQKTVSFSGDVGRLKDPLMKAPETLPISDILVVESTYGDRLHSPEDPKDEIEKLVKKALDQKGVLLIPSFAVGRAQLLLLLFQQLIKEKRIPKIPIYLDSPMASKVTDLLDDGELDHHLNEQEIRSIFEGVEFARSAEESKELDSKEGPFVLISASGMATGGRVLHHLKRMVGDSRNTVLFAGYQAAGTRGQAMVHGADQIKIHGAYYPVKAQVEILESLSAHADQAELLEWLKPLSNAKAPKVYVNHGEPISADRLRQKLSEQFSWEARVPEMNEELSF
jgi:metallo-beta-lactamase family protein